MIRLLHLGTESTWRGGENQMRLLIEGLQQHVEAQFAATPLNSIAYGEKRWSCETLGLSSGSEWDPRNIWQLVQFIKKNKINLLDAHTAKAHSLALKVATFVPSLKIVVHRRVDNVPKKKYFTVKKYFHPRVNRFTCISHFIAEVLKEYGVSQGKIRVARSAVSAKPYEPLNRLECQNFWKSKLSIPSDHILIGNASALSPQKGYETLLQGVADLKTRKTNFSVLIAGDGGLKDSLMKMAQNLGIQDRVYFTGFIKDVPTFLSALDILAVSSNNEGLGTIILDGFLAGCCVVGSEVGGIPEIVKPQVTGLLQSVGDYQALSKNLEFLIDNPDKRKQWAEQGKEFVKKEFSLDSMVQGNLKIYKEVMNEN